MGLRDLFFRWWYGYVSSLDRNGEVRFMNYGYVDDGDPLALRDADEVNRPWIQLYERVVSGLTLKNKTILEIGCGRGGGLDYLCRYKNPERATGLDLEQKAVEFCRSTYRCPQLDFIAGNAMNLDLPDESTDVVINVESSHRYPDRAKFYRETHRVLRDDGIFAYTDFFEPEALSRVTRHLTETGFAIVEQQDITRGVLDALDSTYEERIQLIRKLVPRPLWGIAGKFAAAKGSPTYRKFQNGDFVYFSFVLGKE